MASTSPQTVFLSPLDQYMPRIYIRLFLIFETNDPHRAAHRLKVGLQRLGLLLPFIKGHVSISDSMPEGHGRTAIRWSEAEDEDIAFREIPNPPNPECISLPSFAKLKDEGAPLHYFDPSFCPLPSSLAKPLNAPVLVASYTVIEGGLVLGLCVHHNVMDGTGTVGLIRSWADCTRLEMERLSLETLFPDANEPLHRAERLEMATTTGGTSQGTTARRLSLQELLDKNSPDYSVIPKPKATPSASDAAAITTTKAPVTAQSAAISRGQGSKLFAFDVSKLEAAKEGLLMQWMTSSSLGAEWLTTNSILCAVMWSCITRIRSARIKREGGMEMIDESPIAPRFGFAIDGRRRLGDAFSARKQPYLGNIVIVGLAALPLSDVTDAAALAPSASATSSASSGISRLSPLVHEFASAIRRVTPGRVGEVLALADRVPDVTEISPSWNPVGKLDLALTSWANMPLYSCDFGDALGKPEFMRVPVARRDGLIVVLPRKREGTGNDRIEVIIDLIEEDRAALEEDEICNSWLVS
ncbi:transferase family-domain-containing protein [Podospora didyma]|uniref:Transferase family-domain-containing protein n=1 Tax=Podospora didyma TaxID=330526 RepID=A0AAE0K4Y1_9PEZI|nr:transferase family-domain-containing protein [Podospora didyma]